jgi:DNA-binding MarR family transcriptional regulator
MSTEINHELIAEVLATADAFLREGPRLLKPHGLTVAQYNVLNVLAESGSPTGLSQRELSDELVVDRSNVTGLLDRMEIAGWVRRMDDLDDRRIYRVRLTTDGRRLWEKVAPRYAAVVKQVTRGLTERQTRDTLATLGKLKAAAAEWKLAD